MTNISDNKNLRAKLNKALIKIEELYAELAWIDAHLFQYVDTDATRKFVTAKTKTAKRLLRICDLLDVERKTK